MDAFLPFSLLYIILFPSRKEIDSMPIFYTNFVCVSFPALFFSFLTALLKWVIRHALFVDIINFGGIGMFKKIGKKLMMMAKWICWLGIISTVILGSFMLDSTTRRYRSFGTIHVYEGVLMLLFGPLCSWICSSLLYAFGQLVDDVQKIKNIKMEMNTDSKDPFSKEKNDLSSKELPDL